MTTARQRLAKQDEQIEQSRLQLEEKARALELRRGQLQKTAALGAQLQGIQSLLTELGQLEEG